MAPEALLEAPAVGTAGPVAPGEVVYGVLRMGGVEVALPLGALREVVPCPDAFASLPASTAGLLGAMSMRELVVPVLDLRPRLGMPAARGGGQVVVVVTDGERLLGVLADEARDVVHLPSGEIRPVRAGAGAILYAETFRHPADGRVVSVLDPAALLRLDGVPTVHDPGTAVAAAPEATDRRDARHRTLTLLRCDEHVLGIDVAHVHTTLADATAIPSALDSPLCRGVTEYGGARVPLVDPLALLGLGALPAERTGAGVVLALGEGFVVLAVTSLVDIVEVAPADVLPLPGFSVRRPDLLAGIADVPGAGHCLALDGEALRADADLAALASMNEPLVAATAPGVRGAAGAAAPGGDTAGDAAPGGRVYLTYSVGHDVATPLEQVAEIVPFPATRTRTDVGGAVLGVAVHRGTAVPVVCLATLLGLERAPVTSATCLLVVEAGAARVGFAVQALRSIDPLTWERKDAGRPGPAEVAATEALRAAPLISVGEDTRLLPDLDLHALARAVLAERAA